MCIEIIWKRLIKFEGEIFYTVRCYPFSYRIENNILIPIRNDKEINRKIPKSDIEKALSYWPIPGPGVISSEIQGSSYVYGLLSDNRILGSKNGKN